MKRLYLTVEGQTEAGFAMSVLAPHLVPHSVFLSPPRFTGLHRRRRGRIPRGGLLHTFSHTLSDVQSWLREDRSADARFSMMIDLYGVPPDFPGYPAAMKRPTGAAQAEVLEQSLASVIGDIRFIPYLQVHEYEALVLVDPRRIGGLYESMDAEIDALCRECDSYPTPEDINHGLQSHPKYRIQHRVPKYDENIAGPLLAEDIGLATLRSRCPHFAAWLTRLEQLDTEGLL